PFIMPGVRTPCGILVARSECWALSAGPLVWVYVRAAITSGQTARKNSFRQHAMRFRKLRIAWSVFWGAACVLLIVLWVRSYWWFDEAAYNCEYKSTGWQSAG